MWKLRTSGRFCEVLVGPPDGIPGCGRVVDSAVVRPSPPVRWMTRHLAAPGYHAVASVLGCDASVGARSWGSALETASDAAARPAISSAQSGGPEALRGSTELL